MMTARFCLGMCLLLIFSACSRAQSPTRVEVEPTTEGFWMVDGGNRVLFFQKTPKSEAGRYERSNYVHPLLDLDGNVLTEDFPADHRHHRGVFTAWHQVLVGERSAGDAWATVDFQWRAERESWLLHVDGSASLTSAVAWRSPKLLDEQGKPLRIARETTTIRVFPRNGDRRVIDWRIDLQALTDKVRFGGSDDRKGYGGFSLRIRLPKDIRFAAADGEVEPKTEAVPAGPWMDMTATFREGAPRSGITVLGHPGNPGAPHPWILRRKGSMQNAAYPGRHATALSKSKPTTLRYRIVLHRQEAMVKTIDGWFKEYAAAP